MPRRPPPPPTWPPEALLIYGARERLGLSYRQAAWRAGISESMWRRVEKGHMLEAGGAGIGVRGTPGTVARMAQALYVTAGELRGAGRGDAASDLEKLPELDLDAAAIVRDTVRLIETDPKLSPAEKRAHREDFQERARREAGRAAKAALAKLRAGPPD